MERRPPLVYLMHLTGRLAGGLALPPRRRAPPLEPSLEGLHHLADSTEPLTALLASEKYPPEDLEVLRSKREAREPLSLLVPHIDMDDEPPITASEFRRHAPWPHLPHLPGRSFFGLPWEEKKPPTPKPEKLPPPDPVAQARAMAIPPVETRQQRRERQALERQLAEEKKNKNG